MGALLLRLNPIGHLPSDKLGNQAALAIQSPSEQYRRLTAGVFFSPDESLGVGRLVKAFKLISQAEPVLAKIHAAQKNQQLPRGHAEDLAQDAGNKNLISGDEAALLRKANAARLEAIEVDVFTAEQYFGTVGKHGGLELGEAPLRRAVNG